MGDPTLRMEYVAPPSNPNGVKRRNFVQLNWSASTDDIVGYYVYRASSIDGPYNRITNNSITSTSYTDLYPPAGEKDYMVKAVALTFSASGSYYNPSQGIFFNLIEEKRVCNDQICEIGENEENCPEDCECSSDIGCFDLNICTTESCNVNNRCVYINNQNACNDNRPCTINDRCSEGICIGMICLNGFCKWINDSASASCSCTQDEDCSDGNLCTTDSCVNYRCSYTDNQYCGSISDFNNDKVIDGSDLTIFAFNFGKSVAKGNFIIGDGSNADKSDLDDNGVVDGSDLTMFAFNFGKTV